METKTKISEIVREVLENRCDANFLKKELSSKFKRGSFIGSILQAALLLEIIDLLEGDKESKEPIEDIHKLSEELQEEKVIEEIIQEQPVDTVNDISEMIDIEDDEVEEEVEEEVIEKVKPKPQLSKSTLKRIKEQKKSSKAGRKNK